jgi:predicted ATPase
MLVQFRVENHRSLRDEQTLSLAASGDEVDPRLIAAERLGTALLPAIALYGANASGKSNVLHALAFMSEAVQQSHRAWEPMRGTPREPFALSDKAAEPSLFEVDIVVEGTRYRYGFVLGEQGVDEEWLTAWPKARKQIWFEREGASFKFGKHLRGENDTIQRVTRSNSLFLSAATQNNHQQLAPVFAWFAALRFEFSRSPAPNLSSWQAAELEGLFADSRQMSMFGDDDARRRHRASVLRLLKAADLGIQDIKLRAQPPTSEREVPGFGAGRRRVDLMFQHRSADGKGAWLPLTVESAGTVTLLGLAMRVVDVLRRGALLCVDELEASLHPMLALELLRLFQDRAHNPHGAQLIFTTHDTNLLGNILGERPLRRDQVWFTEKDEAGATHIYPLTDFQPRKEENLERGYLQGRYGAVPCLGELLPVEEEA